MSTSHPDLASVFDELSVWSARFGALLFDHIDLAPNLNILDLACGPGFPLIELAQLCGYSCRVTGLDVWPAGLVRAKFKLDFHRLPNAGILQGNGAKMPFRSAGFDLIVSNLGVNNFENAAAVMSECYRLSKPGGKLVLTTNLTGHMREFYAVYRNTLIQLNKSHYLENLDHNEHHRGSRESVCDLLETAGYAVVKVVEDKFLMQFVDGSALFRHSLTRYGFLEAWRAVIEPEDEVEIFTAIEAQLNKVAYRQGRLKMTIPMLYVESQKP